MGRWQTDGEERGSVEREQKDVKRKLKGLDWVEKVFPPPPSRGKGNSAEQNKAVPELVRAEDDDDGP